MPATDFQSMYYVRRFRATEDPFLLPITVNGQQGGVELTEILLDLDGDVGDEIGRFSMPLLVSVAGRLAFRPLCRLPIAVTVPVVGGEVTASLQLLKNGVAVRNASDQVIESVGLLFSVGAIVAEIPAIDHLETPAQDWLAQDDLAVDWVFRIASPVVGIATIEALHARSGATVARCDLMTDPTGVKLGVI